ncbi:MAG: hypothetical protein MI922_09505, partial [Bacteroidales bacterium]|nr:hypothetical protein [Bacteroidales bacterium]
TSPATQFELNTGSRTDNNALLRVKGEMNPGLELYSSGEDYTTHISLASNGELDRWDMIALGHWTNRSLGFFYNDYERLIISNDGKVGIGTLEAACPLEITGTMQAKQFIASTSNFPDYVFEEGYDVMSLNELETYVQKHRHLPNMPSEKEVIANGMNINNVAIKSVENIETIYLHLIELTKKVDVYGKKVIALEKENAILKNQLAR